MRPLPLTLAALALAAVAALLTGCDRKEGALGEGDPVHAHGVRLPPVDPGPPPSRQAVEPKPQDVAVRPPPFSPGIFPCTRCHEGARTEPDLRPAIPHARHLARDLQCEDCHMPDGGADPKIPQVETCFECHEDLAQESEALRAYFKSIQGADGKYTFVRRWKTRDVHPMHGKHAAAKVACTVCHGEPKDTAFEKPRAVPLMKKCVACHEDRKVSTECATCHGEIRKPQHDNIVLHHAEDQRGCLDCHSAVDRDYVHLANGTMIPFDQSYKLCGQCHGPKLRDWKLGIHGKRVGQWDGQKSFLLCVQCHNPHQPQFPPMTPVAAPMRPEDIR